MRFFSLLVLYAAFLQDLYFWSKSCVFVFEFLRWLILVVIFAVKFCFFCSVVLYA